MMRTRKVEHVDTIGHIMQVNVKTKKADALKVYFEDSDGVIYVLDYDATTNSVVSLRRGFDTLADDLKNPMFLKHRPMWVMTEKHRNINKI